MIALASRGPMQGLHAKLKKNPQRGGTVYLGIDEESIHLFDKETKVSIRK
jgi:hypothetical protein